MLARIAPYAAALAVLLLAWKGAAMLLGSGFLPQPEDALAHFCRALGTGAFWKHFGASAYRAGAAMSIAWCAGFPAGVLMGGVRVLDRALSPFVFLTYPIPKIVLLPITFLLLGLGDLAKIGMIAVILGYQVLVTTRDGVAHIHPKYLDSVRSLGAGRRHELMEVLVPAALPHGFTALRLNSGVSVAVLFFVESFATQQGLGYLIMDSWGRMDFLAMFTGIIGMSLLGVALYEIVNILERRVCSWNHLERG